MSAATAARALRVHVSAADAGVRDDVAEKLRGVGIAVLPEPDGSPGGVVVTAAGTVGGALEAAPPACRAGEHRLVVVADSFCPGEVRSAVALGARVMLPAARVNSARLAAAVHSASSGDGRLPYELLLRVLGGGGGAGGAGPAGVPGPQALTARQTTVLRLMADGHGNRDIARALDCSEHTVRNLIHDLMGRLQVHNRAHAVASAVRAGLI